MNAMQAALLLIKREVIEVREDGTIWKLRNVSGPELKKPRRLETKSKRGYLAIRVTVDGKHFMMAAHRLVWTVLRGPIPAGMDINHLDGAKHNNRPGNLEPATRRQNHLHAYSTGLRSAPSNMPPRVLEGIAKSAKALRAKGMSFLAIAKALGVSQTTAFRATRLT